MKTLIKLLLEEQSDLGLHCLPKTGCPKTSHCFRFKKTRHTVCLYVQIEDCHHKTIDVLSVEVLSRSVSRAVS